MQKDNIADIKELFGGDILSSAGMQLEKNFRQHGGTSVYAHSFTVAVMCVHIANVLALFAIKVNLQTLIRGALLHDYFLYDWHIKDRSHKRHGLVHAGFALDNARRDFQLNNIEQNMIASHMFPLSKNLPRYRESLILCAADKLCAAEETVNGYRVKAFKLFLGKK